PAPVENNLEVIAASIQAFLGKNRDPKTIPSKHGSETPDDMRAILATLEVACLQKKTFLVLLLKLLKVLLRRPENRADLGREGVNAITNLMSSACLDAVACESANVVLNMCYDMENVHHFLEASNGGYLAGGLERLASLIRTGNENFQASGLGALQSVCFGKRGRQATRDGGVIGTVVQLLDANSPKVRARALGTIHNLSTDARSIGIIREEGGLPRLVKLLRSHEAQICGGAAGTIQNLSREEKSRTLLTTFGVVEPLADLLFGRHLKSQV
ncbi:unnamed protein product, partial [Sphacelaria rigidula]